MRTKFKISNRILSLVLAFVMMLSMLPMTTFPAHAAAESPCSGDHTGWTAISGKTDITKAGKYYLSGNVNVSNYKQTITINCSGEVTLCLNGKSLRNTSGDSGKYPVYFLNGTLNLCDCIGTGYIQSPDSNGIAMFNASVLNMYGGTIKDCYCYSGASAVLVGNNSTFNMYGGTITNNRVGVNNYICGAVEGNNINLYGGSITGNEAYGVVVSRNVYISGNAKITDNTLGDVYLNSGKTITVGTLTTGADIGVTSASNGTHIAITGTNAADYSKYFHADNSSYQILNKDNVIYLHKHSYAAATCVAPKTCACGLTEGSKDSTNHNISTVWTSANGKHYKECLNGCGTKFEEGTCSGGTATCVNKAVCDTCQKEYGSTSGHSLQYSANENVITETCKNNCGHKETATLSLDTSVSLNYTGSEIKPLKVEYSDGWQGGALAVTYSVDITSVGEAKGVITKDGATVAKTFTISKGEMSGISVNGYSGVYDGNEHGISITNAPADAEVTYSTSENGAYTSTNPTYKDKGSYTVWYKIEKENYETVSGSASVVISQATNDWTTDPSIAGWTYGETAKTPSAAAQFGTVKVDYRLATETDADYTTDVPTEAGSYLVRFSVEGNENYTSLTEVVELKIAQVKLTVTADDKSKTYGESDPTLTWQITEGKLAGSDMLENISISREEGNDTKDYAITVSQTEGSNPNYDITFKGGTFTINQKTIGISWGITEFTYNGETKLPTATPTGAEYDDELAFTVSGGQTEAGTNYTATVTNITGDKAANYKLPTDVTTTFVINKGTQTAPSGLGVEAETIDDKADGKITGVNSTMEYRKEGETSYKTISGTEIVDLADDTYYVRYAETANRKPSPDTTVVVGAGRKLTVTVPSTQVGYTLVAADTELVWNGSTTFTFALADGYSKTNDFAVKVNGNPVELNGNQYVISNAQENITITVEGVADTTAPTAEITLGTNKWNSFFNTITFGLFFKETQSVTVSAEDVNTGSGIDKVYYYLTSEELTEDAVKALADWTEYKGAFSINPNNKYIIYVKAVDKAGNATYVSSEYGIVLDAVVPVITGVDNNATYYGDTAFGVDETYMDTVTVDGNKVELTDGKYTITADGKEHTIVAVDKAGNSSATVKITVITIASLDDTIEDIKTTDVKSSDKEDIQEVLDFVNSLIDSGKDFTDAEDKQLSDIKSNAENLLKQISDTEAEAKDLTDKVGAYEEAKVTSDDKQTIKDLVSDIDVLLNGDNLTETEKEALGEVKADAEALIKKIDDAAAADDTDNTEKVKDITSDNVTTDDKADLEKAKDDLEKALEDYKDNLTEDEKKAIEDEIDRIDKALEVIEKVEKVEDTINKLPDTITKNDADAIKAAEDAYNALSKYEQSIVDKDTKKKLDAALKAVEEINAPKTGDSSNHVTSIWMMLSSLVVMFGVLFGLKKKKEEE